MESQANERKEEETEKEAERISEKRKSRSKTTGSHNQKSEWDCTRVLAMGKYLRLLIQDWAGTEDVEWT